MTSKNSHILLVDDDPGLRRLLSIRLESEGYQISTAEHPPQALSMLDQLKPDLVITDLRMDEMDGLAFLKKLQQKRRGLPVLLMSAHGTISEAVDAVQGGAFDFLTKPIDKEQLLERVEKALAQSGIRHLDDSWHSPIITENTRMQELIHDAGLVAQSDTSVMLMGESGTGKEMLAQAIHNASHRNKHPFVAINCGAMPENLLESELFGHVKGAFTGASRDHTGLIRSANGGTLFLDEIGDMPLPLQVKLLRVIQDRRIRPVGDTQSYEVNVRILSATHRNLQERMQDGSFREDLYYRLNVVSLSLPPLAERADDIPLLVNHFLQEFGASGERKASVYSPEAMECLVAANWPGNIRQLRNVVEQNVALSSSPVISVDIVEKALGGKPNLSTFDEAREEFTRSYLLQLLKITQGNVSQAARLAERNRTQFYKLLSRHNIDISELKNS